MIILLYARKGNHLDKVLMTLSMDWSFLFVLGIWKSRRAFQLVSTECDGAATGSFSPAELPIVLDCIQEQVPAIMVELVDSEWVSAPRLFFKKVNCRHEHEASQDSCAHESRPIFTDLEWIQSRTFWTPSVSTSEIHVWIGPKFWGFISALNVSRQNLGIESQPWVNRLKF